MKRYEDKSSCKKRGCAFWKNQCCVDCDVFRINGSGDLCCRYHPDAVRVKK